jgi:4-carboxymuconolactone decarboxylase
MNGLTLKEQELVAIGSAIGSNCIPCVEYHIVSAKKLGLSNLQILEAIKIADKVKKAPSEKVLNAAMELIK